MNEKGNDVYKLDQMAPLNGIKHVAHQAIGDVMATVGIAKISKKAPNVWKASMLMDKTQSLEIIKKNSSLHK